MEIAGFIIAVLSLVLSGYLYFRFDRKLKKQETLLNDFQLKAFEEEERLSKTADVSLNLYNISDNHVVYKIKVFNRGKADATNINVVITPQDNQFEDATQIYNSKDLPYTCLHPQDSFELQVRCYNPSVREFVVTWEDEIGKHEKKQNIQLKKL